MWVCVKFCGAAQALIRLGLDLLDMDVCLQWDT